MTMEILDTQQTADRLGFTDLADSIREVMVRRREGELEAPPRLTPGLPEGGTLLVMPAADEEIAMTKIVTVHPENAQHDLPTIQGEVVVMDAKTGVRLGILEGSTVTGRRTAALSLLAAQTLAKNPDGPLLILGAGTQAKAHLEAFREGLGVSKVFIVSRTEERAYALAEHARSLGMEAEVKGNVEEVLDEVSLIVTATTSHEPVLPEELPADMFVAAVGAFNPEMAELSPGLTLRSYRSSRHPRRRTGRSGRPHTSRTGRRFPVGGCCPTRRCPAMGKSSRRGDSLQECRRRALGSRRRPYGVYQWQGLNYCTHGRLIPSWLQPQSLRPDIFVLSYNELARGRSIPSPSL